jgi:hypothetical protein
VALNKERRVPLNSRNYSCRFYGNPGTGGDQQLYAYVLHPQSLVEVASQELVSSGGCKLGFMQDEWLQLLQAAEEMAWHGQHHHATHMSRSSNDHKPALLTGKTTVARLYARMLEELGVLPKVGGEVSGGQCNRVLQTPCHSIPIKHHVCCCCRACKVKRAHDQQGVCAVFKLPNRIIRQ